MEPFDPIRNEEGSGYSKRRTSILKMPRKSIKPSEVEQQEHVVECPKPSDKRISRRVSFAPANDVLLFQKDVKNHSPLQNPLQEFRQCHTKQSPDERRGRPTDLWNGDRLKAPKQTFQQKETVSVYGEKTILLPAEDLDMTQCHTVRIANKNEFLDMSLGLLHGHGEKTVMFDTSMDMTMSQTLNMICDQDVSFSSKPAANSPFPFTTQTTPVSQFFSYENNDKENLVPKLSKSIIKKRGDPIVGSVGSKQDVTEVDPLQGLFPPEIYTESDEWESQAKLIEKKITAEPVGSYSKRKSSVNFDLKDEGRSDKTVVFSDGGFMELTQNFTSNIVVTASVSSSLGTTVVKDRKTLSSGLSARSSEERADSSHCRVPLQERAQHTDGKLQTDSSCKGRETTLTTNLPRQQSRDKLDDTCMDMTRNHTVRISSDLQLQPDPENLPYTGDKTVRFTANDAGMDMTQCLTLNIAQDLIPRIEDSNMFRVQRHPVDFDAEDPCRERTVRFAADEALMDETHCHTVHIAADLKPHLPFSEKTIRFDVNDAAMDVTRSHTVNISNDIVPSSLQDLPRDVWRKRLFDLMPDDATMDMTRSQTAKIYFEPMDSVASSLKHGENTVRFDADDATMDMTRSQTANIYFEPKENVASLLKHREKTERFDVKYGEKTVRFDADDATMDMTRSQTANIYFEPKDSVASLLKHGENTVRFDADDATMDMTRSQTAKIYFEPKDIVASLPKHREKTERF
ncbi:hypothetical protein WMY93_015576 [Mugilogobius chulae]|uniref:Protein CASC5 n=1 Tax=Mugilogobius chulae TaxID=88201 RepID=A0AAW0NQH6_9GOBI